MGYSTLQQDSRPSRKVWKDCKGWRMEKSAMKTLSLREYMATALMNLEQPVNKANVGGGGAHEAPPLAEEWLIINGCWRKREAILFPGYSLCSWRQHWLDSVGYLEEEEEEEKEKMKVRGALLEEVQEELEG